MGISQPRYRRLALVLVVAVFLLAGGAVAESADATRDGDILSVTVQAPDDRPNATATVSLLAEDQTVTSREFTFRDGMNRTWNLSVGQFREVRTNLSSVDLTVTIGDQRQSVGTVDLRNLESGGKVWVGVEQAVLTVNESATVGVPAGSTVPVRIEDELVEGSYRDGAVRVSVTDLRTAGSLSDQLQAHVLPNGSNTVYEFVPEDQATATITFDEGAYLGHLSLDEGIKYTVAARTTGPAGTFNSTLAAEAGPKGHPRLEIPSQLLFAEQLTLRVERLDGRGIIEESGTPEQVLRSTAEAERLTWNTSSDTVSIPGSESGTAWIRIEGTDQIFHQTYDNATLTVPDSIIESGIGFTLLVVDGEGRHLFTVDPVESTEQDPSGPRASGTPLVGLSGILGLMTDKLALVGGLLGGIILAGLGWRVFPWMLKTDPFWTGGTVAGILGFGAGIGVWSTAGALLSMKMGAFLGGAIVLVTVVFIQWVFFTKFKGESPSRAALVSAVIAGVLLMGVLIVDWQINFLPGPTNPLSYGFVYGLGGAGTVLFVYSKSRASKEGEVPTYRTNIHVQDTTGASVEREVQITLTPDDERNRGASKRTLTVTNGRGTVELRRGVWEGAVQVAGRSAYDQLLVSKSTNTLTLTLDAQRLSINVRDQQTDKPIEGAKVRATVGETTKTGRTNSDGSWKTIVPFSASETEVILDHDRYERTTWSGRVDRDTGTTAISLRPLTGSLTAPVTLSGQAVLDLPVTVTQVRTGNQNVQRTDENGTVSFEEIPIGEYTIEPDLSQLPSQFTGASAQVEIMDQERTERELTLDFDYTLPAREQERIETLRDRAGAVGRAPRRDEAIPAYYASVLEAALNAVESVPRAGNELLQTGLDPDELVSALLNATATALESVEEVMTSTRNVDLFAACADLPAAEVSWEGVISISRVTELAGTQIADQRGAIIDRLETVDDRVSQAVGDVAEVSPAREMWEAIRALIRDQTETTQTKSAALIAVAEALLDAVEELFDNDQLRERLNRTVY